MPLLARRSLIAASAAILLSGCAHAPADARLAPGKGMFSFSAWKGPPLSVHTYVPGGAGAKTPVLFVMHGAGRNAAEFRDYWVEIAERKGVIVVSPEFDAVRFPGIYSYAMGGMTVGERYARPKISAFDAIEPIFDAVRARTGSRVPDYVLFGHSAGGQFAHRFVLLTSAPRASHVIASGAGWYTFANATTPFPDGLGEVPGARDMLKRALSRRMTILLGTADNDPADSSLPKRPAAAAQGPHRLARGESFFADGRKTAAALGVPFGWTIKYATGVGHYDVAMVSFAYDVAFPAIGSR